ncbi:hypothetical protein ILYODFUR_035244 [Ilyodon furcidens]|uniref:Uncharacterized protein n=1 Tax=Ilyodon furcidens TaxID=33524 RepID=A0ABV0U0C9_9TELE
MGQQDCSPVHFCVVNSLKVTHRITCLTPFKGVLLLSLKITMQILLFGPRSWPQPSTYLPFMDICFTSCAIGQTLSSSAALPANILCICNCELWSSPTVANRWPLHS